MTDALGGSDQCSPLRNDIENRLTAGDSYIAAWWTEAEASSLEHAVTEYRAALVRCPVEDWMAQIRTQISLSNALRLQFEEGLGEDEDEEETFKGALDLAEGAVQAAPPSSTLYLQALRVLGEVLLRPFHASDHLQQAVDTFRELVGLTSECQSDIHVKALALYANALSTQYDYSKNQEVVELANATVDQTLALLSGGQVAPPEVVEAQSRCRVRRGMLTLRLCDIDESITVMQNLIHRSPLRHPRLHYYYNLLGFGHQKRYTLSGAAQDLDDGSRALDEACKRISASHPAWHRHRANRFASFFKTFFYRGELNDLAEAIAGARAIVNHALSAPARKVDIGHICAGNLVIALTMMYSQTGKLELLDEAIAIQWDNLNRAPISRRPWNLNIMSFAYRSRFLAQGRLSDLESAIAMLDEALETQSDPHDQAGIIGHLANALLVMYNERHTVSEVDRAISLLHDFRAKDGLRPQQRGYHQSMLGLALLKRASITASVEDVQRSIQCQRRALELLPQEDPNQLLCYFRLGLAEYQTFEIGRQIKGVGESIAAFNRAISIMPAEHGHRASYLSHLSKSLLTLSHLEESTSALIEATQRLREAALHSTSWIADRYEAAILLASTFHRMGYHADVVEAYRLAISLLPELASFGLEDELRMEHIRQRAREVPQDAAACALESGEPALAIELLEAGRTVLWNAGQELKADLTRLRKTALDLAMELAQTNAALQFRPQIDGRSQSNAENEIERRRVHRLASKRTELICQIRSRSGFERFLLPATIGSLVGAAVHGPIVMLNCSIHRCDALLVYPNKEVTTIPLTEVRHDQIQSEANALQYWLAVASRDHKSRHFLEVVLLRLLKWLWKVIGRPVCAELQQHLAGSQPHRVWWCPTGALSFLPIHACGPYEGEQLGMTDMVISSYTPTISAILRAQKQESTVSDFARSASQAMLVISQPAAPGHVPLPAALDEMHILEDLFPQSGTFLVGPEATLPRVEAHLRTHSWLHVISHGSQSSRNPLQSSLALHDGPLTLSRLAQAHLPHAEFAFLSACHSAKGTTWIPDESMHLAAGMMFAGFRSVVATAWGIADKDAPEVTRVFYKRLIQKGVPLQATDTAEALHMAVRALRKSGIPAQRWVPFIHIGA